MAWRTLNLNATARVKPTEQGKIILRNYDEYLYNRLDDEGYVRMPLWEVAHIFGPEFYLGNTVPINMDILIQLD